MQKGDTKSFMGNFPADCCEGKHLISFNTNNFEYQYVGDAKAALLQVIDSKQRLKNGRVFSNLDYKKFLSNTIQSISIELRTETVNYSPFRYSSKKLVSKSNGIILQQSSICIALFFGTL